MNRYAYLDIEANHTNWLDAEIIELAIIIKDEAGNDLDFFHSFVRPDTPVQPEITQLTGITQNMVKNAPPFHKISQRVFEKIEDAIIIAHKAAFDYDLLKKEFFSLGMNFSNKKQCTLELSKSIIPGLNSYSLASLCQLFGVKHHNNHRAMDDVNSLYQIHTILKKFSHKKQELNTYLPKHKKLIINSSPYPGVIIIKDGQNKEVYKTDNIKKRLEELLLICPKNKSRLVKNTRIDILKTRSLVQAGLLESKLNKTIYPYCVYKVIDKQKRFFLRVGQTHPHKKALIYTKTKIEAKEIIKKILNKIEKPKLIFQDKNLQKSNYLEHNLKLLNALKDLCTLDKNYFIRSKSQIDNKYDYTIIQKDRSYASFQSKALIRTIKDLKTEHLKFKKLGPREFMSFNHSIKWIKNQKNKTDLVIEFGSDLNNT